MFSGFVSALTTSALRRSSRVSGGRVIVPQKYEPILR